MLHMNYIGLLNTDHQRPGPVQAFLQGHESPERYVLDRLPAWIEHLLCHTKERMADVRYISGANLDLLDKETREVMYQSLLVGGYKVRPVSSTADYCAVNEVFVP